MPFCYKCGIKTNETGLCDKCKKGIPWKRSFDRSDYLSYEEYHELYLNESDPQSIALADDELLLYERYKKDKLFDPTLRGDVSYREAYELLNQWFFKNFIKYLLQRLQTLTVSKQISLEQVKKYGSSPFLG